MGDETWDRDQVGPMQQLWGDRLAALEPVTAWRPGRILRACGYAEIRPALLAKIEPTPGHEPPKGSVNDVLVTQPSAAHWIADQIEDLFVAAYPDALRRPGDMMFSSDALDKLAAAGCVLEERDSGGVTIHLPATGGSIDGTVIAQMMSPRLDAQDLMRHDIFFPIAGPRNVHDGPDYLKHDPTKRHSRKRPTTKRNKRR